MPLYFVLQVGVPLLLLGWLWLTPPASPLGGGMSEDDAMCRSGGPP